MKGNQREICEGGLENKLVAQYPSQVNKPYESRFVSFLEDRGKFKLKLEITYDLDDRDLWEKLKENQVSLKKIWINMEQAFRKEVAILKTKVDIQR